VNPLVVFESRTADYSRLIHGNLNGVLFYPYEEEGKKIFKQVIKRDRGK
jgi:hypothetical protein